MKEPNDFVSEYETKEMYGIIREIVKRLPTMEQEIIDKLCGFTSGEAMEQNEIAKAIGKNPSTVPRKLRKILLDLRSQFEEQEIIEIKKILI